MEALAQAHLAPKMAAYMKGHFAFLGVNSASRKEALKALYPQLNKHSFDDIIALCKALYALPQ